MSYTLISRVSGTASPLDIADAKKQLRITHSAEDAEIQGYLDAAIEYCEDDTQRLMQQSLIKTFLYSGEVKLSRPVRAIIAIKYIDSNDVEQSITTDYEIIRGYDNGVDLKLTTIPDSQQIWVEYISGYGNYAVTSSELKVINETIGPLPSGMKTAALLVLGDLYKNRENSTDFQKYQAPISAQSFLDKQRIYE